ncbi:unnamed protein product [Bursaphelenchus xylophilus]|uniref:(pine wood nematode) hypothetical protein n=1 Tax=Bursaphelenchus xylophilus TaxID=6326 RepID=A0A1I7RT24_BURXY|nr:unnamed protein product [Bursaphelenchus xylophilus]CAG9122662.1 unnamed protein product [Bursaphelenchus xylophilus]
MSVHSEFWDVINRDCKPPEAISCLNGSDINIDGDCTVNRVKFIQNRERILQLHWNLGNVWPDDYNDIKTRIWQKVYWRFDQCVISLEFVMKDKEHVYFNGTTNYNNSKIDPLTLNLSRSAEIRLNISAVGGIEVFYLPGIQSRSSCRPFMDSNSTEKEIHADVIVFSNNWYNNTALIKNVTEDGISDEEIVPRTMLLSGSTTAETTNVTSKYHPPITLRIGLFFAGLSVGIGLTVVMGMIILCIKWKKNKPRYLMVISLANSIALRRYQIVTHQNKDVKFAKETDEMEKKAKELRSKLKLQRKKKLVREAVDAKAKMESETPSYSHNMTSTTISKKWSESELDQYGRNKLVNRKREKQERSGSKKDTAPAAGKKHNSDETQQQSSAPHASDEM